MNITWIQRLSYNGFQRWMGGALKTAELATDSHWAYVEGKLVATLIRGQMKINAPEEGYHVACIGAGAKSPQPDLENAKTEAEKAVNEWMNK